MIDIILSLVALIILEIVLGIDNLVLLTILTEKLPREQRKRARRWGLACAWITRLLLLFGAFWIVKLTHPLVSLWGKSLSLRDLFLLSGGAFLIAQATQEIHREVADDIELELKEHSGKASFLMVIVQVAFMDIIFSLDSVLTAIGLTRIFWVMAFAITIAILVMIYASEIVAHFIEKNPTIKMLALSFLMLIGMVLMADGLSFHVPRGYIYFAMGFSLLVELLNNVRRKKRMVRRKQK